MRAYTLRAERKREKEREKEKEGGRQKEKKKSVRGRWRGRKRGEEERRNIARRGLFMRARTYIRERPGVTNTGVRAPYQHAKLDFMCDRMPSRRIHTQIAIELRAREIYTGEKSRQDDDDVVV